MKILPPFFVVLSTLSTITAQTTFPANENNAPAAKYENAPPFGGVKPRDFEDYLVQLAWRNDPAEDGLDHEVKLRNQEISLAKIDWTRNLGASVNFNESNYPYFLSKYLGIKESNPSPLPTVINYPLWNIGIGVNVGDLFMRKHKVKVAEERVKIAESDVVGRKQKIKAETLARYQTYQASIEILKVRLQSFDAAEANKIQIANLFAVNKVKYEDYNSANKTFYDAFEAKIKAETDLKVNRIRMEEMIGVRWESAERVRASFEPGGK